jgi:serine/threonine protein phosphatase PrpC
MRLRAGAATDTGRVRQTNEDAFLCQVEDGLFVVCDGMGGAASGEVASQLAVQTVKDQLKRPARRDDETGTGEHQYLPHTFRLGEAVRLANRTIYDQARATAGQTGMGTTMVGAWVHQNIASLAHVGDSRAYLWRNDVLEPVTTDHSLVEAQVKAGLINREQSLQSEHQNILLRALGREPIVEVELSEVPVQSGDYLLLCSDGLTRMVPDAAIGEALVKGKGDPQRICDQLVAAANDNGGHDNVTVLVVEVAGSRLGDVFGRWRR